MTYGMQICKGRERKRSRRKHKCVGCVRGTQFGYIWLHIRKRKKYEERKSLGKKKEGVRPNQKDSVCIFTIFCTFIQVCADLEASVSSEAVTISCSEVKIAFEIRE